MGATASGRPGEDAVQRWCGAARTASRVMARTDTASKNRVLLDCASRLRDSVAAVVAVNRQDLTAAERAGASVAFVDRLRLTPERIEEMAVACEEIAGLPDPVGSVAGQQVRENGLRVGRMRVPLGVLLVIYESRPNVTIEAAALCIKAGNAVILRGGKEAIASNRFLTGLMRQALAGLTADAVQLVDDPDRALLASLLQQSGAIDLVIPRGGEGLIRAVVEQSRIPVVQHYKGVCHILVDASADLEQAESILLNAKVQRPGVCNAVEGLLVHAAVARQFLPRAVRALAAHGVEIRGCPGTCALVATARPATEADWDTEFLDLVLAVRIVDDLDQALDFIARHGSFHTEAIVTRDLVNAERFLREVDASCVLVNASTRFNDGGQLGLGAEIGISTTKVHAYGPMGLEGLTCEKFVVYGTGQVRL